MKNKQKKTIFFPLCMCVLCVRVIKKIFTIFSRCKCFEIQNTKKKYKWIWNKKLYRLLVQNKRNWFVFISSCFLPVPFFVLSSLINICFQLHCSIFFFSEDSYVLIRFKNKSNLQRRKRMSKLLPLQANGRNDIPLCLRGFLFKILWNELFTVFPFSSYCIDDSHGLCIVVMLNLTCSQTTTKANCFWFCFVFSMSEGTKITFDWIEGRKNMRTKKKHQINELGKKKASVNDHIHYCIEQKISKLKNEMAKNWNEHKQCSNHGSNKNKRNQKHLKLKTKIKIMSLMTRFMSTWFRWFLI